MEKEKEYFAQKAFLFVKKYQGQTKRRDGNSVIYTHLLEVAGLVALENPSNPNLDEDLAIALLHDILEDVDEVTYEMLYKEFNKNIADSVKSLTDIKYQTKADTLAASNIRLFHCNKKVQTIKVADIISNTHSIEELEPERAPRYLKEKADQINMLTKVTKTMLAIFLPDSVKKYL